MEQYKTRNNLHESQLYDNSFWHVHKIFPSLDFELHWVYKNKRAEILRGLWGIIKLHVFHDVYLGLSLDKVLMREREGPAFRAQSRPETREPLNHQNTLQCMQNEHLDCEFCTVSSYLPPKWHSVQCRHISSVLVPCKVVDRQNSSLLSNWMIKRYAGVAILEILLFARINTSFFTGEINAGSAPQTTSHRQGMYISLVWESALPDF